MPPTPPILRHREKVLAHAELQLASQGKLNSAELLSLYKKFLKIEDHRLRLRHQAGGGGRQIAQERATLLDIVLRHLYDAAGRSLPGDSHACDGLTIVAIGGYGRGELNPFSDVDIMFLQSARAKKEITQCNEMIQAILYMLWDVGFKVGHSTRTTAAAIEQANADMLSKTSLLEARYLAGDQARFEDFRTRYVASCVKGHEREYLAQRVQNQTDRHQKYGLSVYMQEPNLKNGCGGLRDYQNLLWIAFFMHRVTDVAGLVDLKIINDAERRQLVAAYDFLLRVRTDLHYLHRRGTDVLTRAFQMQIANRFAYPQKDILRRSEAFMREYYQHARAIYHLTELASERLGTADPASGSHRGLLGFLKPEKTQERFDGFFAVEGRIYPETREVFNQDPFRLIRVFQHAQQRQLTLSPQLQQLISRRLKLIDRTFQYARSSRETFTAILSRKGEVGRILRLMHELDLLGRYLPEFGELTCLVQHEFFHRYTADEHTLVCIDKLDALIDSPDPKLQGYRALFQKLEDPFVLYLALLLHDTGKAANAKNHAEVSALLAQKVARRLQLLPERRRTLLLLVDDHLLLSSTAQRRNLDDPETIQEFASRIKNQRNLDALMLLTLADGQGTGADTWSDWKELLVWQLYHRTSEFLAVGADFFRHRKVERQKLREGVRKKLARDFEDELEAHFRYMPESYFHGVDVPGVVAHLRLFRTFLERRFANPELSLAPATKWIPRPEQGHSELWVVAWDREGLLAAIAGSLSVERINILSADIYTRGDSLVLDLFRVCDTDFKAVTNEGDIARVENSLTQALAVGDYDFTPQLQKAIKGKTFHLTQEVDFPTQLAINNDAHPSFTVVEAETPDRLGLLYNILRTFDTSHIDISSSRIATEKGAAIDTFYISEKSGSKITSKEAITRLERQLKAAISRPG